MGLYLVKSVAVPQAEEWVRNEEVIRLIGSRSRSAMQVLRRGNFEVDAGDRNMGTPLFAACYVLWTPAIRRLLALGADTRHCAPWGGSAAGAAVVGALDQVEGAGSAEECRSIYARCASVLQLLYERHQLHFASKYVSPVSHISKIACAAQTLGHREVAQLLRRRLSERCRP